MSGDRVDFSAEAADHIAAARRVLETGRAPRIGEINELFRAAHSLKGLAGLKGFERFGRALHEAESLLDAIRLSRLAWTPKVGSGLERFFRDLEGAIEPAAAAGSDAGFPSERVIASLERVRGADERPVSVRPLAEDLDLPEKTLSCLSEYEESRLRAHLAAGSSIFTIDVGFALDAFETELKALGARLDRDGEWIATLPQVAGFSAERLAVQLLAARLSPPEDLPAEAVVRRVSRGPVAAPAVRTPPSAPPRTVRLEATRLEALLAEAEEARAHFEKLAAETRRLEPSLAPSQRVALARLRERVGGSLARLTRQAAGIRTVPIALLADRLRRAAERLLDASGKKAVFRVVGGDSEIDRALADDLADPLLHIVRNAVDHGLESPAARAAAGKPEEGSITMLARSRSSKLVISIADDGRGIDPEAVARRARALGWLREGVAASPEEIRAFLFRPGFSTASAVSEISGRGVGLDLVADRVSARHGEVRVESTPGRGTRFEIEIAAAQAVFDAIVVAEAGGRYALPLAAIARVGRSNADDGAVPLSRALDGSEPAPSPRRVSLFLPGGGALSVESVLRQEMIVVRPIGAGEVADYLIGASQGRGEEAILVLDPKRLLRSGEPAGPREVA